MKYVRRTLSGLAIYLSLWGINHVIYQNKPVYQQHPERAFSYFQPVSGLSITPLSTPSVLTPTAAAAPQLVGAKGRVDNLEIGQLRATVYHAVARECDANPFITADDSRIRPARIARLRWCGISRGLHRRWNGPLNFGDTLLVTHAGSLSGRWVVRDLMRNVHQRRIDFLVPLHSKHDPTQGTVHVKRVWKQYPTHGKR